MGLFLKLTEKEKAIKDVRKRISSGEFELAKAAIARDSHILDYQVQSLNTELETAENQVKFHKAIEGYNSRTAREALTALRGKVPSYEYNNLEERIKKIEDKHIIAHLNSISFESEREEAIRKFLDSNPESKDRQGVIEYVLARRFVTIEDFFKNAKQSFKGLFEDILNLNNLLERYQNEDASLLDVIDMTKFTRMITEYLEKDLIKTTSSEEKIPGKMVKYIGTTISSRLSYFPHYRDSRSKVILKEMIGEIVQKDSANNIWVLFKGEVNEDWKKFMDSDSRLKEHSSKNQGQRVAYFGKGELEVVELYNEIEKNTVRKELTRMNELFSQFYSKPKPEQEQVEVKTVKPGINELVSQDFPSRVK